MLFDYYVHEFPPFLFSHEFQNINERSILKKCNLQGREMDKNTTRPFDRIRGYVGGLRDVLKLNIFGLSWPIIGRKEAPRSEACHEVQRGKQSRHKAKGLPHVGNNQIIRCDTV